MWRIITTRLEIEWEKDFVYFHVMRICMCCVCDVTSITILPAYVSSIFIITHVCVLLWMWYQHRNKIPFNRPNHQTVTLYDWILEWKKVEVEENNVPKADNVFPFHLTDRLCRCKTPSSFTQHWIRNRIFACKRFSFFFLCHSFSHSSLSSSLSLFLSCYCLPTTITTYLNFVSVHNLL